MNVYHMVRVRYGRVSHVKVRYERVSHGKG